YHHQLKVRSLPAWTFFQAGNLHCNSTIFINLFSIDTRNNHKKRRSTMHIGFLGLGNMGGPMASNLVKAGHSLSVFDLSQPAVAELAKQGAQGFNSVADLV